MKSSPLKRKTPLKRTLLRRSGWKRQSKKADIVRQAQYGQREATRVRSGGRCEFFVAQEYGLGGVRWERCRYRGVHCAHLYSRNKCGDARDDFRVVLHSCMHHHDIYDGRVKGERIRAPFWLLERAYETIVAQAKDKRSTIALLGPRPVRGEGIYAEAIAAR